MPHEVTGPVRENPVFNTGRQSTDPQPADDPGSGLKVGAPALNAAEDPSLQAALRRQGASAGRAREEIARRQARLETGRGRFLEDQAISEERGLESVSAGFESRGLFRSSIADRDRGRLSGDIARTTSRFEEDFQLDLDALARQRSRIGTGGATSEQTSAALRRLAQRQTRLGFVPRLFEEGRFGDFIQTPQAPSAPQFFS